MKPSAKCPYCGGATLRKKTRARKSIGHIYDCDRCGITIRIIRRL